MPDPTTGAVTVPIYQTSTYAQEALGKHKGFEYARTHNVTRAALENNLASLRAAATGSASRSGLAATTTLMLTLSSGDHVIAGDNLYGGTYPPVRARVPRLGLDFTYVGGGDLERDRARVPARDEVRVRRDADQSDDAPRRSRSPSASSRIAMARASSSTTRS